MTLGINVTSNDPVVQGNNEPSGRLNLKGQQKPQYLIDAIEAEEKAWQNFTKSVDEQRAFFIQSDKCKLWELENAAKKRAYARYNQECANG